jgi:hypothetical protein
MKKQLPELKPGFTLIGSEISAISWYDQGGEECPGTV